jgi:DNA (cytosine-5)-methyltransferase 1
VACRTVEAAGHRRLAADIATTAPSRFGELWGLIGSPPCQAYSLAGKGVGRLADAAYVARLGQRVAEGLDRSGQLVVGERAVGVLDEIHKSPQSD